MGYSLGYIFVYYFLLTDSVVLSPCEGCRRLVLSSDFLGACTLNQSDGETRTAMGMIQPLSRRFVVNVRSALPAGEYGIPADNGATVMMCNQREWRTVLTLAVRYLGTAVLLAFGTLMIYYGHWPKWGCVPERLEGIIVVGCLDTCESRFRSQMKSRIVNVPLAWTTLTAAGSRR